MKKNIKIIIDKTSGVVALIIAYVLLFMATMNFYVGYNNTDLIFNYQNIALQINPHLHKLNLTFSSIYEAKDNMSNNVAVPLVDVYKMGVTQSLTGFIMMFFSAIAFVIGITILIAPKPNSKS